MEKITHILEVAIQQQYNKEVEVRLERTDPKFGDFATNIAMRLAGELGKKPRDLAEELASRLEGFEEIAEVSVAGPGFINIRLSDSAVQEMWNHPRSERYKGQVIVAEYSDPNPFKVLHAGHFYTSVVGDTIANLMQYAGGDVHRANFGGDVGLHVGKTMWAILDELGGENPEKLDAIAKDDRSQWMADCYVKGTKAYEEDQAAHEEIISLNKRVYAIHKTDDHHSPFAQVYWTCRQWSYDYFDEFYARILTPFEKYYPESRTAERGYEEVKKRVGTVFEESNDAIIFDGEKHGLHTRVFINREDLPTYEAKDIGLVYCKYDDYHFDKSVIITGNEQKQYMEVVIKALEQFEPEMAQATTHITHGLVKLVGGVKMSSRKGNFLKAVDILDEAVEATKEQNNSTDEWVALGAIKYAFLKASIGGDIIYEPKESVSLQGNSGPYLQYSHARACSLLQKANREASWTCETLDEHEHGLALKLGDFQYVLDKAVAQLAPHLVCTYLYELSQEFNRFYEKSPIIDAEREEIRLCLVEKYRDTLAEGLTLLGIHAPEKM